MHDQSTRLCACGCGETVPTARFPSMQARYLPRHFRRRAMPFDTALWSYVARGADDACWPWTGSLRANGYGQFKRDGRGYTAHRLVWEAVNGLIPPGLIVCHTCDVRSCCNPRHLWLGTNAENSADMVAKGRSATGDHVPPERRARAERNGAYTHPERLPRGENHGRAVLTEVQVRAIRAAFASGAATITELGRRFGVTPQSIFAIVRRKTWRHVA